jgi:hypothetical protein
MVWLEMSRCGDFLHVCVVLVFLACINTECENMWWGAQFELWFV